MSQKSRNCCCVLKRCSLFCALLLIISVSLYSLLSIGPSDLSEFFSEYEKKYSDLVYQNGSLAAINQLKKDYEKMPWIRTYCHQAAHIIGRASSEKYGDIGEAFSYGDPFCWSGYYHGVVEGKVRGLSLSKISLDSVCANSKGKEKYSFEYYNCVHGLGHAMMYVSANDLPRSLLLCDNLSGWWERQSCYGGAFMENIISDDLVHPSRFINRSDPHYPCSSLEYRYKDACYLMQTSLMLEIYNGNFRKVFAECRKVPKGIESICFQSIGRDASGTTLSSPYGMRRLCSLGKNELEKKYCVIGAALDSVAYHHSKDEALEFCGILDKSLRPFCSEAVNSEGNALSVE